MLRCEACCSAWHHIDESIKLGFVDRTYCRSKLAPAVSRRPNARRRRTWRPLIAPPSGPALTYPVEIRNLGPTRDLAAALKQWQGRGCVTEHSETRQQLVRPRCMFFLQNRELRIKREELQSTPPTQRSTKSTRLARSTA
jgi:hypothetical protein